MTETPEPQQPPAQEPEPSPAPESQPHQEPATEVPAVVTPAPEAPTEELLPPKPEPEPQPPDAQTAPVATPVAPSHPMAISPGTGPRPWMLAACLVLFGVLFAWGSWRRDFYRPDEPRFAELTRQMESSGDWVVPRLYGVEHLDGPPLISWMGGAIHVATGLDPRFSYRLPVVLGAILGLWLTFLAGRKLFDGRIGFLAAALQASSYAYFTRASWLDDDLIFAVFVQLALTSFAILSRRGTSTGWAYLGWLGFAGCALTKSALLGLGLVAVPLLLFLFFEGGVESVNTAFRRARNWKAIFLFLLLTAPWYVTVSLSHAGTLLDGHILGQHLSRLFGSPYDARPAYYYVLRVFVDFFPWSLFIPLAFLHGKDRMARQGERLCMFWGLFMLILLSVVSAKKPGYLLVIWPPLALLVAAAFFENKKVFSLWEDYLGRGVFKVFPVLLKVPLFTMLLVGGAYLAGYAQKIEDPRLVDVLENKDSMLWTLGLATGAGALVFLTASRVRRYLAEKALPRAAFEVACATLFLLFAMSFFNEGRNALQSSRDVMARFSSQIPPGAPIAVYGGKEPEIAYYLQTKSTLTHIGYPLSDKPRDENPNYREILKFLENPGAVFVISTRTEIDLLQRNFSSLTKWLNVKASGRVGRGREYVLLCSRKP